MINIGVIGIGRLGICLALNLENVGYNVYGYDIRTSYINDLKNKKITTTEPDVEMLLNRATNFHPTYNSKDVLDNCDTVFIIVSTAPKEDGRYNHDQIEEFIINHLIPYGKVFNKNLVINSTVEPGYTDTVQTKVSELGWKVSYNPEFIRQGEIIRDQLKPDIILIGERDTTAGKTIQSIYETLCISKPKYCKMSPIEAEITKISLNCFLVTKISFANMIGDLCRRLGADENVVLNAIGSDSRIGNKYFQYGWAASGNCFSVDRKAFGIVARDNGISPDITDAASSYDKKHLEYIVARDCKQYSTKEPIILFEGVAFKKGSDIITASQSLEYALKMQKLGYDVTIYERIEVIKQVQELYPNKFTFVEVVSK